MVKNLRIYGSAVISKLIIHKLINLLKREFSFTISNLEISFVNSNEIILINKKYLNHDGSTDIITFEYSPSNSSIEGVIIISKYDAFFNAKRLRTSLKEEILRLLIHGTLHLLGYNDIKKDEKKMMKSKENELVSKYKFLINK